MRVMLFFSLLALVAAPGLAADAGPSAPPTETSAPSSGQPTACATSTAALLGSAVPVLGGIGALSICTAEADCGGFTIDCEGDSECKTQDRNCSVGARGFVDCDGQTTYCGDPCSFCGDENCDPGEDEYSCPSDCFESQCPPCIQCPCEWV